MIFLTVGTHEQQFNRLLQAVDELKGKGVIQEEVIMQTGYSDYQPRYCQAQSFIPYDDLVALIKKARLTITHGGPSSFLLPLSFKKQVLVVPRQKEYGEHINNHQVEFIEYLNQHNLVIPYLKDVSQLEHYLNQATPVAAYPFNNQQFNQAFKKEVDQLFD